jgi:hypothetical protein
MRFDSAFGANALVLLDRQCAHLHQRANLDMATLAEVEDLLGRLESQISRFDDIDVAVASNLELIFRTSRLVILIELNRLDDQIRTLANDTECPEDAEIWRRFLPAIPEAKIEIQQLVELWLSRRREFTKTRSPQAKNGYLSAIQYANERLRRLDQLPNLERLFYRGVASRRHPGIALACERILVAIQQRIGFEQTSYRVKLRVSL